MASRSGSGLAALVRETMGADPFSGAVYVFRAKRVLQVDGYGGYRPLADRGEVRLAFCWAHVRRRFYELAQAGPEPIAAGALASIAALYKVEAEIRGRSPAERQATRQACSRPLMVAFEP